MFKQIQAVSAGYKSKFMPAVESEGLRTGELLRLTGPAIFLDRISGNGRKYIPESVHMQVAELQPRIKQKALFGVLDHPPTDDLNVLAYVKMTDVSHRIDALWFNEAEQTYYITVTILDTPNGRILKAIHDAGSPLFVSLRSLLDPSRNRQNNGYIDAWMLALITIDFVSRPGFADAELKAVDVSNEAAMAVCESLNLFKHTSKQDNSQNSRIFDMKTKKSQLRGSNRKLTCLPAIESIIGIATEPTGDFRTSVAAFVADVLTNLPGRFTMNDFMTQYPDNIFDGKMIGIYEDTNELAITDAEGKTIAMVKLESPIDGVFVLPKDAEVEYFNTEITDNSDTVQTDTATESTMYAVIATEDYTPDQNFINTMEQVAEFMRSNYGTGFDMNTFNTSIMEQLKDQFGVSARIDLTDDQENELKITDASGENGASILLDVAGDQMICGAISEYWMPGTESAISDNVKLIDASGEEIASGELENYGTWAECRDDIQSEDETGYGIMEAADLSDDTECYKIGGNWYYLEDGMTVENVTAEAGTEAKIGETVTVLETIDDNTRTIATGKLEAQGTWGKLRDTIKSEDADAYGWMMNEHVSDDETVWKVDGNWYFGNNGIVTVECGDLDMIANEADDVIKQTEGEIVEAIDIDENYMQQSDLSQAKVVQQAEIIDEEDETAQQNQEQVTDTMYEVVEGDNATTQSEVYEVVEDDKDDVDADAADAEDRNLNELAIEAQRVFNMPNSKFAGNYAIEHMPDAYKHIWSGLSDSAKAVLARQAKAANVATEAQALKFFANTNFIAIERACLTAKGKVEAAFENLQPIDARKSFLGAPLKNRR